MATRNDPVRTEYVEWLILSDRTRRAWGMPLTETEFAEHKGVSARQLRRWKSSPEFQQLLEQRRHETAAQAGAHMPKAEVAAARPHQDPRAAQRRRVNTDPPADVDEEVQRAALEGGYSPERAEYESIKAAVAEKARDGDPQAVDKWMRYWGQQFVEEERAEREAQFAELDDEGLIGEVLSLIGEDNVRRWLDGEPGGETVDVEPVDDDS